MRYVSLSGTGAGGDAQFRIPGRVRRAGTGVAAPVAITVAEVPCTGSAARPT